MKIVVPDQGEEEDVQKAWNNTKHIHPALIPYTDSIMYLGFT